LRPCPSNYLDLLPENLRPSLQRGGSPGPADFHLFKQSHAGFPKHCEARSLIELIMPLIGKVVDKTKVQDLVQQC